MGQDFEYNKNFPLVKIGKFLTKNNNVINLDNDTIYKRVTVSGNNGGVRLRNTEVGKNIGTKRQFIVESGQFILSKIELLDGAMGSELIKRGEALPNYIWSADSNLKNPELVYQIHRDYKSTVHLFVN